ncbi:CDP-glucose 4,6-dehydratase [Alienimonas chondri]|uniref:CDP-glucose 4,6-dehydratase n=1 Tax=Alienimonas chondri TaxID=2681879 RepID=A0ABX1VCE0_9PLAN|nr:CDP-glucose 4,6-dehydratase [Alienimonas chondri]NNJ24983.1 CDP-glucose 4,6-dehydratase [Alienimonas chondri]
MSDPSPPAPFGGVFAGRRVFVTGHTGFKGSWLCLWLKRLGAEATGYAFDPPTDPSHFAAAGISDTLARDLRGDVRDRAALAAAIDECDPDLILHLAAQSVVRTGYEEPFETFETNVMGTAAVLEAVRTRSATSGGAPVSVVCVTSDKCYENVEQVWGYRETDPMGDHDPYGGSKGAAELAIRAYRHSFFPTERLGEHGVRLASVRAGNVIGGGDWTRDALIVDAVAALRRGESVGLRSPGAYRPWQHVLQALDGYLTSAAALLTADANDAERLSAVCSGFNIGPLPGRALNVREVVETLAAEWGAGGWEDVSDGNHPREAGLLHLSIDRAMWVLGWKPVWDVDEALRQTARWYRDCFSLEDAAGGDAGPAAVRALSERQIAGYEAALENRPAAR